jgi:Protein of unknown function (DUF2911)
MRPSAVSLCTVLVLAAACASEAQRPRVSPHESTTANVNGAAITIVYGRPSMRGREIFGALVPYDRIWCPGADEATTLDSTRPLLLGGVRIPPGPHTIWMLPAPDRWTLIISREPSGFHTQYPRGRDLGRVALAMRSLGAPVEQLTFEVRANPDGPGGVIAMRWARTEVLAPFTVVQ